MLRLRLEHLFFRPGLVPAAIKGSLAINFKAGRIGPSIKANTMQSLESMLEPLHFLPRSLIYYPQSLQLLRTRVPVQTHASLCQ